MGPSTAITEPNFEGITPNELENISETFSISSNWQQTSASFHFEDSPLLKGTIYGDIEPDVLCDWHEKSGELSSFVVKSNDGDTIRFSVEGGSLSISRLSRETNNATNVDFPEWQLVYVIGMCLLTVIHLTDQFIDRNGLRPVVDEIGQRKDMIMLTLLLVSLFIK